MVGALHTANNKRMAVPGPKPPSTQMPAWTRGRLKYRSIKLPKPRLTEQYFSIIVGGHFAMRRPLFAIADWPKRSAQKKN
jgi:hypothetical protein